MLDLEGVVWNATHAATGFVQSLLWLVGLDWLVPKLLGQIPPEREIGSVTADGAYDMRKCHDAIAACDALAVKPPCSIAIPLLAYLSQSLKEKSVQGKGNCAQTPIVQKSLAIPSAPSRKTPLQAMKD